MIRVLLDINPNLLQNNLIARIPTSGVQSVYALIANLVIEQIEDYLNRLTSSGEIVRFKVEWLRPGYGSLGLLSPSEILEFNSEWFSPNSGYSERLSSLKGLTQRTMLDLGYFTTTVVTDCSSEIYLEPPVNLRWLEPVEVKHQLLKTVRKYIIRTRAVGLQTDILVPISDALSVSCQCPPDFLIAYIDGVWDPALMFICKVCGRTYFCECFRAALEKQYEKALLEQKHYAEQGWPHKFMAEYQQAEFRREICHLCRDIPSELFYCHPMYGSKVMIHYGPYIVRTAIEKGIDQREAENEIRELLGIPRIGEGWLSEVELLNMVRAIFPDEEVTHQANPKWLGLQRLDIFMPKLKVAVEYQGRQHYEPVPFFGGDEGFLRTQERDRRKAQLCAGNGVTLVYFRYDEQITRNAAETRIKKALS